VLPVLVERGLRCPCTPRGQCPKRRRKGGKGGAIALGSEVQSLGSEEERPRDTGVGGGGEDEAQGRVEPAKKRRKGRGEGSAAGEGAGLALKGREAAGAAGPEGGPGGRESQGECVGERQGGEAVAVEESEGLKEEEPGERRRGRPRRQEPGAPWGRPPGRRVYPRRRVCLRTRAPSPRGAATSCTSRALW